MKIIYPILTASFALACAGFSLLGLLLGSWYLYEQGGENGSKRWLIVIILVIVLVCMYMSGTWRCDDHVNYILVLLSCGVWIIMLTTNLQQPILSSNEIHLNQMGFSFWINIGSSAGYLVAFLLYLIAICKKWSILTIDRCKLKYPSDDKISDAFSSCSF